MHLITGAAGFIGAHLAHELHAEGAPLALVDFPADELKAKNLQGLEAHPWLNAAQVFTKDAKLPALSSLDAGAIQAVWHLGANSDTTTSDWDHLLHVNIGASQQMWRWCAEHGVPFYYASSAATYGDGSQGFSDRTPPELLQPLNLYGKSKNHFDAWVLEQVASGATAPPHWAGFKFFNVYGAREAHKGRMASIIWKAQRDLATLGRVQLFKSNHPDFADGEQRRDFIWVGDVVSQMLWTAAARPQHDVYNVGTGSAFTFLEMIEAYFQALRQPSNIEFVPMPDTLALQYQSFTCADMSKARLAGFGVKPTAPVAGVRATLQAIDALAKAPGGWLSSGAS